MTHLKHKLSKLLYKRDNDGNDHMEHTHTHRTRVSTYKMTPPGDLCSICRNYPPPPQLHLRTIHIIYKQTQTQEQTPYIRLFMQVLHKRSCYYSL